MIEIFVKILSMSIEHSAQIIIGKQARSTTNQ